MNKINKNFENWFYEKSKNINNINYKELEKVTIVIPSYERQEYLLRQLIYWHGSGVNLIILDGSSLSLPPNILEFISLWEDITYLHLPISFEARLNQAINYINTPYVASLSDDEFFLKGALKNLVIKLDEDKDLSGCIGNSLAFNYDSKNKNIIYNKYFYSKVNLIEDNIKKRLSIAMNPYKAVTAYGLLRKDVWQKGWGKIQKYSSAYTSEMHQSITTYIMGKYISTDELFWLRSNENSTIAIDGWNSKLHFHDWWKDKKYILEKEIFIDNLIKLVLENSRLDKKRSRKLIFSTIKSYLKFCDIFFERTFIARNRIYFIKLLNNTLPENLLRKLKSIFIIKNIIQKSLLNNIKYPWLEFTQSNNIEENQKDILEIEVIVKDFHKIINIGNNISE